MVAPPPAFPPVPTQLPDRKEKRTVDATVATPSVDLPSGSGSRDSSQDEVISKFITACPGGGLLPMSSLPADILASKGASLLAEVCARFLGLLCMNHLSLFIPSLYFSAGLQIRPSHGAAGDRPKGGQPGSSG